MEGKDIENSKNFTKAKHILTVVGPGLCMQQIWDMIEETNNAIFKCSQSAYFDNDNIKRLQQYYAGRLPLFVHPLPV